MVEVVQKLSEKILAAIQTRKSYYYGFFLYYRAFTATSF